MTTDISERSFERLICTALTGRPCDAAFAPTGLKGEAAAGGAGWICGHPNDYEREYTVDLAQLLVFLTNTQPEIPRRAPDERSRRRFDKFTIL